jgi:hypothetical protein
MTVVGLFAFFSVAALGELPVLEVLPIKDLRAAGRASAAELDTLGGYITAKLAAEGATLVRAAPATRAAIPGSGKNALPADEVLEVTLGAFGSGCAISATIIDLRSGTSIEGAAERFDCAVGYEVALDRLLVELARTEGDDWPLPADPPDLIHPADVNRLLDQLARYSPSEAQRLRDEMKLSQLGLKSLYSRARAAIMASHTGSDCMAPSGLVGYVTINTKPWASIYLDDRKLGETPVSRVRLPSGCFVIRAVNERGIAKTVKIEVQPNRTLRYQFEVP